MKGIMRTGLAVLAAWAAAWAVGGVHAAVTVLDYRVVGVYPHRTSAFTQGLALDRGVLYESGGGYGQSSLARLRWPSGETLHEKSLPPQYFAEGLALLGEHVYLLSWRAGTGFVHERRSLRRLRVFRYRGEGWGLASDGAWLVMSDGSSALSIREPQHFTERCRLTVTRRGKPLRQLNELEWVEGVIAANIWHSDEIVFIDPGSGQVRAALPLRALRARLPAGRHGTLNGIAWNAEQRQLVVTGKRWPRMFALALGDSEALRAAKGSRLSCPPSRGDKAPEERRRAIVAPIH